MVKQKETKVVKAIDEAVLNEWPDTWDFKVHGSMFQPSGIPDKIYCILGYFIAIEVKDPNKPNSIASPLQLWTIKMIKKAGGYATVCRSPEEAIRKIKKWLDLKQNRTSTKKRRYVRR